MMIFMHFSDYLMFFMLIWELCEGIGKKNEKKHRYTDNYIGKNTENNGSKIVGAESSMNGATDLFLKRDITGSKLEFGQFTHREIKID